MIWDVRNECMSADEREAIQVQRLRATLGRVKAVVPYYSRLLREADINPEDVESLDDLAQLPFTVKDDLRDNYPYGMFVVPFEEVVRIHLSSGTTGKPTAVGYTKSDIALWAEVIARTLCGGGAVPGDIMQNSYGYGMFTGGLGLHYGGELLGVAVLPMSVGNSKRQIMVMQDFGTTLLSCTPSYALRLAKVARILGDAGVNIGALHVADSTDFGVLRFVCDKPDKAASVLKEAGFSVGEAEVLAIQVPHKPGALADALAVIEPLGINIEYLFCSVESTGRHGVVAARMEDGANEKAGEALEKAGYVLLAPSEAYAL